MRVHTRAYRKMLLHALRFPSRPVLGVLIGVRKQGEAEAEIVDVAPLFHSYALAPMLELALSLVELHCKKNPPREIVGCYAANELLKDSAPNAQTLRLAQRLRSIVPDARLVMIDNERLGEEKAPAAVPLMSRDGKTWVLDEPRKGDRFLLEPERLLETNKSLSAAAAATLTDFETHLADPNKSFLDADDAR